MFTRRTALSGLAAIASANLLAFRGARAQEAHIVRTDADWRSTLTPDQYAVLRKEGTERPFTSPLLHEERKGVFACAGCSSDLFSSSTKFDSGTGWPSFWAPLDKAVDEHADHSPSRPRLRRRTKADRPALLHERRRDDVQARNRLRR
jgi:peptide-methionine (R)-S-oxide reductase